MNLYESDSSFTKYKSKIKPIALYYPEYNNISYLSFFKRQAKINQLNSSEIDELIELQTELAKKHGIYGFAIHFDLFNLNYYNDIITNFFSNKSNFPFFLIWKNKEKENIQNQNETEDILINTIQKYIVSENYIKFENKPIFSISNPTKLLSKHFISNIRKKAMKEIGEIFIFYPFIGNFTEKKFLSEFDGAFDFSKIDLFEHKIIKKPIILYYSGIIYKNLILNKLNFNFTLFRSCYLNYKDFNDYSPEKFYIANNLIFEWLNTYYFNNNGIIFVNSWNNYKNGNYLESDEIYGYASINTFSKSLFNLPFQQKNFSLFPLQNITIAVQIHVFYEELLLEIIDKLNLIPLKYDLYISTISEEKKIFIEKCMVSSNANTYEIKIYENKGRDIFPFLKQMKSKFKNYKYICHIHTKKSNHDSLLGSNWRNYIFSNLLGSKDIISEILVDFEKNIKLGFIFPETYYDIIKDVYNFDNVNFFLNEPNKKYMNIIIRKMFKKIEIGEKFEFPVGNMFWAKTKAIYQIFNIKVKYPKELNQTNETIMHGIERIWLYIVKLNGYYYKTIFKHY